MVAAHKKATEGGVSQSLFDLGQIYEEGVGVTPDLAQAAGWYRRAQSARVRGARDALSKLLAKHPELRQLKDSECPAKTCSIESADLTKAGPIRALLSSALRLGLGQDEAAVKGFLESALKEHENAEPLIKAAATRFGLEVPAVKDALTAYVHSGCK